MRVKNIIPETLLLNLFFQGSEASGSVGFFYIIFDKIKKYSMN